MLLVFSDSSIYGVCSFINQFGFCFTLTKDESLGITLYSKGPQMQKKLLIRWSIRRIPYCTSHESLHWVKKVTTFDI